MNAVKTNFQRCISHISTSTFTINYAFYNTHQAKIMVTVKKSEIDSKILIFTHSNPHLTEEHSEPIQTSKVESLRKIVSYFRK